MSCPSGISFIYLVSDGRYKVVFCDTDRVPALETKRGARTTNEIEAALIKEVLLHLNICLTVDGGYTP